MYRLRNGGQFVSELAYWNPNKLADNVSKFSFIKKYFLFVLESLKHVPASWVDNSVLVHAMLLNELMMDRWLQFIDSKMYQCPSVS